MLHRFFFLFFFYFGNLSSELPTELFHCFLYFGAIVVSGSGDGSNDCPDGVEKSWDSIFRPGCVDGSHGFEDDGYVRGVVLCHTKTEF